MEKRKKSLIFSFLTSFYLVVILFISFYLMINRTIFLKKAVGEESIPIDVRISNINSSRFTVSWITEENTTGSVIYAEFRQEVENQSGNLKIVNDIRGENSFSKIHYVTLKNLSPAKNYYFAIKSGPTVFFKSLDGSWNKVGVAEEQKTVLEINFDSEKPISSTNSKGAYSLEPGSWNPCPDGSEDGTISPCFRPNFVWGQVVDHEGSPIEQVLVFLKIPGKSSLLSVLTDNLGKWSFSLANFFNESLTEYLSFDPKIDLLLVQAEGGEKGKSSTYSLIPSVFAQECLNLSPKNCSSIPLDLTNPLILEIFSPPSPTPTPLPVSPTPTLTSTPLPSASPTQTRPPEPTSYPSLEVKVKFQAVNQKGPEKTLRVIFKNNQSESLAFSKDISLPADDSGNYYGTLDSIPSGLFDIFIKEYSHLQKSSKSFKVKSGKNLLDITSSPLIAGDLNNDNRINIEDLGIMFENLHSSSPQTDIADLNFDGLANSEDLGILINNYRQEGE